MSQDFEVADVFADVARALLSEEGAEATLNRITKIAVETIDACQYAGVSLIESRHIRSVAATDEIPRIVDAIQDETQEGPCVDAIREDDIYVTGNLATDERWPNFAKRAHEESGISSVMSFRLYSDDRTYGAINLFSEEIDAFGDDDIHLGSIFSAHAAVAFAGMLRQQQFDEALESRDIIGRAKGILSARSGMSDEEAFATLRAASQRLNLKLRDVARDVAEGRTAFP